MLACRLLQEIDERVFPRNAESRNADALKSCDSPHRHLLQRSETDSVALPFIVLRLETTAQ